MAPYWLSTDFDNLSSPKWHLTPRKAWDWVTRWNKTKSCLHPLTCQKPLRQLSPCPRCTLSIEVRLFASPALLPCPYRKYLTWFSWLFICALTSCHLSAPEPACVIQEWFPLPGPRATGWPLPGSPRAVSRNVWNVVWGTVLTRMSSSGSLPSQGDARSTPRGPLACNLAKSCHGWSCR